MALIVGIMYLPMSWATASTVAVVVLSAILIASLKKQTFAFKIFTHPKVVYIGLISYSLYLWHWGVLSISRWTIGIHWWSVPFQVFLMLFFAAASFQYIETPLRQGKFFGKRWKALVFGVGIIIVLSGVLVALGKPLKGILYIGDKTGEETILNGCSSFSSKIIVVGDSHALEISKAVNIATKSDCSNFIYKEITGNSFLFSHKIIGTEKGYPSREVRLIGPDDFILQAKNLNYSHIIINPYWVGFFSSEQNALDSYDWIVRKHVNAEGINISSEKALSLYIESINKVASSLPNTKLIIVAPEPEFNWVNKGGLPDGMSCKKQWFQLELRSDLLKTCQEYKKPVISPRSSLELRRKHIIIPLIELEKRFENVYLFDPFVYLCEEKICSTHDEKGIRQFRDDDHISSYGASKLAPGLREIFDKNDKNKKIIE